MDKLDELRKQIDLIDEELLLLFEKRFDLCKQIGQYKKENNLPIEQLNREEQIKEKIKKNIRDPKHLEAIDQLWDTLFLLSKKNQEQ